MQRNIYRYVLKDSIDAADAAESLLMAVIAVEGLFGQARVRMDAWYKVHKDARLCLVDASTDVGKAIAKIFASYLINEFGVYAFIIERTDSIDPPKSAPATAEPTGAAA